MKLDDLGFWIAAPTVRLTENHPCKAIRVLGVLGMFPLFPLLLPGAVVLVIYMGIEVYKEI
jgi:hypothetical protein